MCSPMGRTSPARRPRSTIITAAGGADTPRRLLDSALEMFSERGFDGATTREIAARAGVNLGLVQYHFGGKEKLWRAAVDHAFADLWAALDAAAAPGGSDPDRLAAMIRAAVHFAAEHPALVRLMNDEGKREGPRLKWLVDRHGRRLYDMAGAVLASARHGALAGLAPVHLYYAFVGAVAMMFSQAAECRRLTGVDPTTSRALVDAHADAMVRLFLGAV
jgi:AcrR family transcriptional regulator